MNQEDEKSSAEDVKDWASSNFEAVKTNLQKIQKEMRNNKPQENINVRKVSTEDGEKIVVEYSVERWYSAKYFKKMLEDDEDELDF